MEIIGTSVITKEKEMSDVFPSLPVCHSIVPGGLDWITAIQFLSVSSDPPEQVLIIPPPAR